MHPEVIASIDSIRDDRIHGASWLAREAIAVLMLSAKVSTASNAEDFLDELKAVADEVIGTRPSMASISNGVYLFTYHVRQRHETIEELDRLKDFTLQKGAKLIVALRTALERAAQNAAEAVLNGDRIVTCSYSSTVSEALNKAKAEGKQFEVIAAESKSSHGESYGQATAKRLREHRISVSIIPDGRIEEFVSKASKAIVGADSVLSDGSILNGTPTLRLAEAAADNRIPFFAVCETAKFNIRSHLGEEVSLEPGFDKIPARLITGIITEHDTIRQGAVGNIMKGMEKYFRYFSGL